METTGIVLLLLAMYFKDEVEEWFKAVTALKNEQARQLRLSNDAKEPAIHVNQIIP